MDQNAYEGSSVAHDLNDPLPKTLEKKFGFIYDGGTLEHVFNAPTALDNAHKLLKPGGIFVSATCGNGWFGYGFWQMSPEIVFSYWAQSRGYEVLEIKEVPVAPRFPPVDIPDTRETGKRSTSHYDGQRVYLWYVVRKPLKAVKYVTPQQSDYSTMWQSRRSEN